MVAVAVNHISLDERGVAFISGTSIKVADIVVDTYTWNLSPGQIQENYPRLSLAEIHAALAYYHDHQAEMEQRRAEADREYEQTRAAMDNPLSRQDFEQRLTKTPAPS